MEVWHKVSVLRSFSGKHCTRDQNRNERNRPLPSSKNPHFQNEAKYTTFLVKMSFICMRMKNHFHMKGWALNLVFMQSPRGTRKGPIVLHRYSNPVPRPCLQHCSGYFSWDLPLNYSMVYNSSNNVTNDTQSSKNWSFPVSKKKQQLNRIMVFTGR